MNSLGLFPGAYLAKLAAGGWPNTSAQLKPTLRGKSEVYHQSFTLTLAYLVANPTSRVHSVSLAAAVQSANPQLPYALREGAVLSAALSITGGFKGVPGTTYDPETKKNVEGIWLTKP